jgi:hypothetical protein
MDIKEISVDQLIPYEFNNKIHDETQVNRIANSIKEFWFLQPIVIDKNNIVVVWHWRLEGAKKLWLKTVPCLRAENLTDEQIKKYRILDNKLNESERDIDNLKLELEELSDLDFWDLHLEISDLFPDLEVAEEEKEIVEDETQEPSQEAKIVGRGGLLSIMKTSLEMLRFNKSWRLWRFDERRTCRYAVHRPTILSQLWEKDARYIENKILYKNREWWFERWWISVFSLRCVHKCCVNVKRYSFILCLFLPMMRPRNDDDDDEKFLNALQTPIDSSQRRTSIFNVKTWLWL